MAALARGKSHWSQRFPVPTAPAPVFDPRVPVAGRGRRGRFPIPVYGQITLTD